MSYTEEMFDLLIRYTKDIDGTDITYERLRELPYWRCVWGWWQALAHYGIRDHYKCLEDVPEGLESYTIITSESWTQYWKTADGHKSSQTMDKKTCRSIYS